MSQKSQVICLRLKPNELAMLDSLTDRPNAAAGSNRGELLRLLLYREYNRCHRIQGPLTSALFSEHRNGRPLQQTS